LVALFDEAAVQKKEQKKTTNAGKAAEIKEEGCDGGRMKMFFERLKQIVKPFILRRRKVDVLHELVKKEQHVLQVDLGDGQQVAVNVRVAL
jgi:SNF2 family DNA or RNA helicase